MRDQVFTTAITDLLGIRHPILCGGMGPAVSDGRFVAAVVNAGAMGFIVAGGYPDPDQFREQLQQCRQLVDGKPFGVNLYISRQAGGAERVRRQLDVLIEEQVSCVEIAGASPAEVIPVLREAGVKILHKVPAVRYAHSVARLKPDAIIIVGNDCGGHPGIYGISSMVQAAQAAAELDIPVVIGGGIGTGRQMAAVLAMGPAGVIMGTRLMVAEELWIHRDYKQLIVDADGTESVVVKKAIRDNHRVLLNDSAREVLKLDAAGVTDFEQFRPHVMGHLAQESYRTGNPAKGMLDFGPAAVFADSIKPMEQIIDEVIDDALLAVARLNGTLTSTVTSTSTSTSTSALTDNRQAPMKAISA